MTNKDIVAFAMMAVALFGVYFALGEIYKANTPFSEHQPMEVMQAEYQACKLQAPEGFDCIMAPMLVSEQYIKETADDFK